MLKAIPGVPRRLVRRLTDAVAEGVATALSSEADPGLGLGEELQGTLEHPWAFQQIQAIGEELTIVEVGGGDPGLRLTLARAGHRVIAVGPTATTTLGTVVGLRADALATAAIPDASVDVFVSIKGLERLPVAEAAAVTEAGRRLLRPGGHVVLTTGGTDVTATLRAFDADLVAADLVRRRGFSDLALGPSANGSDATARCVVARKRGPAGARAVPGG